MFFKANMWNAEQIPQKVKPNLVKSLNKDVSIINWLQIKLSLKQYWLQNSNTSL